MINLNKIIFAASAALMLTFTSCDNWLDLYPEDNFSGDSFWKTEAHAITYMDGLHSQMRDMAWQHTMTFGELRGGRNIHDVSADGMSVTAGDIILQNFNANKTGVSKFGDIYGKLANVNLFINRITDASYVTEDRKSYYLAQAYGLRAFYYFDLYRVYGGVPLRLKVDVVDGEFDPTKLYMKRSTPKEVMTQIKSDIEKSMELFGDRYKLNYFDQGKSVYWTKAATETLRGEVYLWTSKVTTGDDVANPSDISIAKESFLSVADNYGLTIQNQFADVFDATIKSKATEVIFAIRYQEGEATNSYGDFLYNMGTGSTKDRYKVDGELFGDALDLKTSGRQYYEYKKDVFNSFEDEDSRKLSTFIGSYEKDKTTGALSLYGTHVIKNIGLINKQGIRVYCGDIIYYRLPLIYTYLAEIANFEGNNADVEKYLNLVRERAYAANWDIEKFGYKASDYLSNELAILFEKDKEFLQEGQRWWDLRRMTDSKGGKPLVFSSQANPIAGAPLLDEASESHKLLWPIDVSLLNSDPELKQTPGY